MNSQLYLIGVSDFFAISGDFVDLLLDELLKNDKLAMTNCCNELNAGYAADGYCRATGGLGVVVVTYMVGSLSLINAVGKSLSFEFRCFQKYILAGAYSDDLPLLVISGGPNSHDTADYHLIHHTIGEYELYQASKCFQPVVAKTYVIKHIDEAIEMIDDAIVTCLSKKKPVYLEIACNLVGYSVSVPVPKSLMSRNTFRISDSLSVQAAVDNILYALSNVKNVVLIGGMKIRPEDAVSQFTDLANALGIFIVIM